MHKLSAAKKGGRHCMSRFFFRGYLRTGRSGIKQIFPRIRLRHLVSGKKSAKFKSGYFLKNNRLLIYSFSVFLYEQKGNVFWDSFFDQRWRHNWSCHRHISFDVVGVDWGGVETKVLHQVGHPKMHTFSNTLTWMFPFIMPFHVNFLRKRLPANCTLKLFLSCMNCHMPLDITSFLKPFATKRTN